MADGEAIDDFLDQFKAIENAWALLNIAEEPSDATITAAIESGARSSPVLVRAAALLTARGSDEASRSAIERALAINGPSAPAQIAYARHLRSARDLAGARHWYRSGLLRARPDIALMLDYAALEQELGEPSHATRVAAAAHSLPSSAAAQLREVGRRLAALGRGDLAGIALAEAWRRGDRGDDLLALILTTDDAAAGPLSAPLDPAITGGPTIHGAAAAMRAHARLAASSDSAAASAAAKAREMSPSWVPFDHLAATLRERIERRAPFSWIRLGDGEARFLLQTRPTLRAALNDREAHAIVDLIWSVWFGEPFARTDPARVAALGAMLDGAVERADLLGVTSAERLAGDAPHVGYCTALETYLASLPDSTERRFTDAGFNIRLHETQPFLGDLLGGLDFLGVVGPHPDLAARLQRRHGIARIVSHEIPGEGRLGRKREQADRGKHFPETFDRLMTELTVPFPGAVFLVAGGLLGKIYCDRIRTLGGIALDIGALADAWVGINSRGRPLDQAMREVLPA